MSKFLDSVIERHGGLALFESFSTLDVDLVQGGVLWALKGKPTLLERAHVTIDLGIQHASHSPFAPTQNHSNYTPNRVTIETPTGEIVEDLQSPRASFAGYEMETPWSNAQVGYFAGYTMWTYLTSPFLLKRPGVISEEIDPWIEQGETWRRLRVIFPEDIATHSVVQTYYFDERLMLRRHDYEVDIQGSNPAARYLTDPVQVQGIKMYTKFRIFPRNPDNTPNRGLLIVSVDLSNFAFS